MPYIPAQLEELITRQFFDPAWDPGLDPVYIEHSRALHAIMMRLGEPAEGSLFNRDKLTEFTDAPAPEFLPKRRNFALFASGGRSLLEVGFNAGHSCLIALTVNPDLVYTGVDIACHSYTQPCFDYLRSAFGSRVNLHIGDSRDVLPALRERGVGQYDLYHLDGGHGFALGYTDLCNMLSMARKPATLLFDDTDNDRLDALCDYYVMLGRLSRVEMKRLWSDTICHRLFRTVPN